MPSPSSSGARRAARDRELSRVRILALVQAGRSYAAIGREEGLSRERARQIVAQALAAGEGEAKLVQAQGRSRGWSPPRGSPRGVADGELRAIDRLLRVLDRLDKYSAVAGAGETYEGDPHARLTAKINAAAQRIRQDREAKKARETPDEEAPDEEDEEAGATRIRQTAMAPLTRRKLLMLRDYRGRRVGNP